VSDHDPVVEAGGAERVRGTTGALPRRGFKLYFSAGRRDVGRELFVIDLPRP
jgi:hypothetical protein